MVNCCSVKEYLVKTIVAFSSISQEKFCESKNGTQCIFSIEADNIFIPLACIVEDTSVQKVRF